MASGACIRAVRAVKAGHRRSGRNAGSSRLLITGLLVRFQRGARLAIKDLQKILEDNLVWHSATSRPLLRHSHVERIAFACDSGEERESVLAGLPWRDR